MRAFQDGVGVVGNGSGCGGPLCCLRPSLFCGDSEPSPTVLALYPDQPWRAESALRVSVGPETTEAEVGQAISIMRRVLARGT